LFPAGIAAQPMAASGCAFDTMVLSGNNMTAAEAKVAIQSLIGMGRQQFCTNCKRGFAAAQPDTTVAFRAVIHHDIAGSDQQIATLATQQKQVVTIVDPVDQSKAFGFCGIDPALGNGFVKSPVGFAMNRVNVVLRDGFCKNISLAESGIPFHFGGFVQPEGTGLQGFGQISV
jgi:hypothetical protein